MSSDPLAVVRTFLAGQAAMTAVFGGRIYSAANLPADYEPENGPAVIFRPRGGGLHYSSRMWEPSLQFRIYAASEMDAWNAWQVLFDCLNDRQGIGIKYARLEDGTFPEPLTEPDVNWNYVLAFFVVHIAN